MKIFIGAKWMNVMNHNLRLRVMNENVSFVEYEGLY